ncbi:MAG TPA: hypothetical protein VNP94_02850, partial [Actinomycetota bacterium]|nr:hypothetical protein [Actinomycetota bacterium]
MAEREPDAGGLRSLVEGGGNGHAPPGTSPEVEAYEQDWYRSLKALAERARQLDEAEPGEAEPAGERIDEVERASGPASEPAADVTPLGPDPGVAVEPAAPAALAEPPPSPVPGPRSPSLASSDAAERRAALEALAVRGVSEADLGRVAALVVDPDRDVRRLALEILTPRAADVSLEVIRQGLQDPADEVRAAAVRLAAARPVPSTEIAPLIAARRSPVAQAAALAALPSLIRAAGPVDDEALDALLWAAAELPSPLTEDERAALGELGRLLGPPRLAEALAHDDARRLGALRLLTAEGSPEALAAAAELHEDPDPAVRELAAAVRERLAEPEAPRSPEPEPGGPATASPPGGGAALGPVP